MSEGPDPDEQVPSLTAPEEDEEHACSCTDRASTEPAKQAAAERAETAGEEPKLQVNETELGQWMKLFECPVCLGLFKKPVTTSCGHSFCAVCLCQAIDANRACPVCRRPLPQVTNRPVNVVIESSMKLILPPSLLASLESTNESATTMREIEIPLFGLGHSFFAPPGSQIFLRVFEPRYRLLMARCREEGIRFGIPVGGTASQGVLVRVDSIEPSPAGDLNMQGYVESRYAARKDPEVLPNSYGLLAVQGHILEDNVMSPEEEEACRVMANTIRAAISMRLAALSPAQAAHIIRAIGPPPSSPTLLSFWLLSALDAPGKLEMLFSMSLHLRLQCGMDLLERGADVNA